MRKAAVAGPVELAIRLDRPTGCAERALCLPLQNHPSCVDSSVTVRTKRRQFGAEPGDLGLGLSEQIGAGRLAGRWSFA